MPRTQLLPGESLVAQWADITLTNFRVWTCTETSGGRWLGGFTRAHLKSFPVELIQSVALQRTHRPILILVALAAGIGGALATSLNSHSRSTDEFWIFGAIVAALAVFSYFLTRKVVSAIKSEGELITVTVSGRNADVQRALLFLDHVEEQAILARQQSSRYQKEALTAPEAPDSTNNAEPEIIVPIRRRAA